MFQEMDSSSSHHHSSHSHSHTGRRHCRSKKCSRSEFEYITTLRPLSWHLQGSEAPPATLQETVKLQLRAQRRERRLRSPGRRHAWHVSRVMMVTWHVWWWTEYQSDDRVTKQFISQPVSWPAHCLCLAWTPCEGLSDHWGKCQPDNLRCVTIPMITDNSPEQQTNTHRFVVF